MIYKFKDKYPQIDNNSFVAEGACIIGDVVVEAGASIWFNAVLRGDSNRIHLGRGSNIQDNCVLHVDKGEAYIHIGENVTVGHGAILHGCNIGDNTLIGMGAIVLDGVCIGDNTIIGAGSLVTGGKKIPSGVLCIGSPAKIVRELTEEEKKELKKSAEHYIKLWKEYKL